MSNTVPGFNFGSTDIRVRRLLLTETGTYNVMFNRPYEVDTNTHALDSVIKRVAGMRNGVEAPALAGIAGSFLHPTASVTPGRHDAHIPNGWGQRRLRFVLEVVVRTATGKESSYWFQGFTDHLATSPSGHLDPNARYYLNSMLRVAREECYTPNGVTYVERVIESSQLLDERMLLGGRKANVWRMRPCDVFSNIQSNHLRNGNRSTVYDSRITAMGLSTAFTSSRSNNIVTNYLGNFLGSYQTATELAAVGQGNMNIINKAQANAYNSESEVDYCPFLRALTSIRQVPDVLDFTLNELKKIDPNMPKPGYERINPANYGMLAMADRTAYWHGSGTETLVAATLANAVPAMMMEHFIGRMHFTATNTLPGPRRCVIAPGEVKSFVGADMSTEISLLMRRLENEVFWDISHGNEDSYHVEMMIDVFADTTIRVRLTGPTFTDFTVPSFGDGLFGPVFTTDDMGYGQFTSDLNKAVESVREVMIDAGLPKQQPPRVVVPANHHRPY